MQNSSSKSSLAVFSLLACAGALHGQMTYPMPVTPSMRAMGGGDEFEPDLGEGDGDGGMDMRRMAPGIPGEKPLVFKTDLGKKIQRLQFQRSPQSILAARVRLAAMDREARLIQAGVLPDPDAPKPDEKNASAKADASKSEGKNGPKGPLDVSPNPAGAPDAVPGAAPDAGSDAPAEPMDPGADAPAGDVPGAELPGGITIPAGLNVPPEAIEALRQQLEANPSMVEEVRAALGAQAAMMAARAGGDPMGAAGEGGEPGAMGLRPGAGAAGGRAALTPAQQKAKAEAAKKVAKQVERFRLLVVAGDWTGVGAFIQSEGGVDKESIYAQVLAGLLMGDQALVPDEVLTLSEIAPGPLEEKAITKLGQLLRMTAARGSQSSAVAARIKAGTEHFGGADPAKRKNAATLLVAAGLPIQAQEYLPPLAQAQESHDPELLNLYAVYFDALAKAKQGTEREAALNQGWQTARAVLALDKATAEQRARALELTLGFLPDVAPGEGEAWLNAAFKDAPDLAWKAIESVNAKSRALRQRNGKPEERLAALKAAKRIGQALVSVQGDDPRWRTGLNMLTMLVLDEAETTKQRAAAPQGDEGNPYANRYNPYGGYNPYGDQQHRPQFIPAEQLTEALPDAPWLRVIDPGLGAKLELMVASTAAAAGDHAAVFAMIAPIAQSDPERAEKLGEQVVATWPAYARRGRGAYDVNMGARRMAMYGGGYNPYMGGGGGGYGGYDGAVPLTRAKQQRNLEQLKNALGQLAQFGLKKFPSAQLVGAFAASHSDAEAYRAEDIAAVFGAPKDMSTDVRRDLVANMRSRLVSSWRQPQVQQQAGTKRTDKQLTAMVQEGYATALELATAAAEADVKSWEAALAVGDLNFDLSEFMYGQKADLETYARIRNRAFGAYENATQRYGEALAAGTVKPTAHAFVQWFSAALGASDLGQLTRQDNADADQIGKVKAALLALPGEQAQKHLGLFAQETTAAMASLNPELKPRYVRNAVSIFGEHPDGKDARALLSYYGELTDEITLVLSPDGGTSIRTGEPFGVQMAIWCTRAVARESGNFGKYLQNEYYHPVTGQPVQYKDDLEKKLRAVLGEKFEVQSVTFHQPTVQPMGIARAGWEQFPLAYILLKAKDAAVDRIPAVQMDMDFSDGQGLVILPIASQPVLIDARGMEAPSAAVTVTDLAIDEILDDRPAPDAGAAPSGGATAGDGKPGASTPVRIEVRAKGKGLIPPLERLLDMKSLAGGTVDHVEDRGLNVVELDTATADVLPVAERSWVIHVRPTRGAGTISFPTLTAAAEGAKAKLALKKYSDADLVDATPVTPIAAAAQPARPWWPYAVAGAAVLAMGGLIAWLATRAQKVAPRAAPLVMMPSRVTPFSAVATLRRIEALNGRVLSTAKQRELTGVIAALESRYFGPGGADGAAAEGAADSVDRTLEPTLREWVGAAQRGM
ncbi:hypothetical protein BH11PLA1_BH11PLA1_14370 [soil metagenome]